jgi:hypothetical protein
MFEPIDWKRLLKRTIIAVIIILSVVLLYYTLLMLAHKDKLVEPKSVLDKIDTLKIKSDALMEAQKRFDSASTLYNNKLIEINSKLDSLGGQTETVKNIYHNKITTIRLTDDPSKVKDFFKTRYKFK